MESCIEPRMSFTFVHVGIKAEVHHVGITTLGFIIFSLAHLGKIEAISLAETNEDVQQTYEELRQLARKGAKDWQR